MIFPRWFPIFTHTRARARGHTRTNTLHIARTHTHALHIARAHILHMVRAHINCTSRAHTHIAHWGRARTHTVVLRQCFRGLTGLAVFAAGWETDLHYATEPPPGSFVPQNSRGIFPAPNFAKFCTHQPPLPVVGVIQPPLPLCHTSRLLQVNNPSVRATVDWQAGAQGVAVELGRSSGYVASDLALSQGALLLCQGFRYRVSATVRSLRGTLNVAVVVTGGKNTSYASLLPDPLEAKLRDSEPVTLEQDFEVSRRYGVGVVGRPASLL